MDTHLNAGSYLPTASGRAYMKGLYNHLLLPRFKMPTDPDANMLMLLRRKVGLAGYRSNRSIVASSQHQAAQLAVVVDTTTT